jgi:hypothetical protein
MNAYKHLIGWHIWLNVLENVEVPDTGIYMITDIPGWYYLLLPEMHGKASFSVRFENRPEGKEVKAPDILFPYICICFTGI